MSDDIEDSDDDRPAALVKTVGTGHSIKTEVKTDNSVNKHLPYIWFNGVLSALALGLSIGAILVQFYLSSRSTVSENHWRDIERDFGILKHDVQQLEKEHERR